MYELEDAVELFRCPETGARLHVVDEPEIERLNEAIRAGDIETVDGDAVEIPVDAALRPNGTDFVYAVRGGIPDFVLEDRLKLPPDLGP